MKISASFTCSSLVVGFVSFPQLPCYAAGASEDAEDAPTKAKPSFV